MLCTSLDSNLKKFGDYGVAIHNLAEFGQLVTRKLYGNGKFVMGPITYGSSKRNVKEKQKRHIGFIKPCDFKDEKEYRFLWIPQTNYQLGYLTINCPEARVFFKELK